MLGSMFSKVNFISQFLCDHQSKMVAVNEQGAQDKALMHPWQLFHLCLLIPVNTQSTMTSIFLPSLPSACKDQEETPSRSSGEENWNFLACHFLQLCRELCLSIRRIKGASAEDKVDRVQVRFPKVWLSSALSHLPQHDAIRPASVNQKAVWLDWKNIYSGHTPDWVVEPIIQLRFCRYCQYYLQCATRQWDQVLVRGRSHRHRHKIIYLQKVSKDWTCSRWMDLFLRSFRHPSWLTEASCSVPVVLVGVVDL